MTEQVLDVKGSLRLLRRFWRTIAIFALVGVVVAGAYELTRPPSYQATALVLLPGASSAASSGSQTSTGNDIVTDARIATSAAVLSPAGRQVDPSLSLTTLQGRVTTTSSTSGVLGIVATGSSADQAVALANAVAHHLVSFVTSTGATSSSTTVTGLQAQANQLTTQINDVQQQIVAANARLALEGSTSAAGQGDSSLVGQLTSEQTNLSLQLNSVKSQITQVQLGQVSANQGTEVIQQATAASSSMLKSLALGLALGILAGALLGSIVILARHRRDAHLFTRDEVAEALGSPVALSLHALGKRSSNEWTEVLERYEPTSSEQWNVRKALRELGVADGGAPHLVVLVMAGDAPAVALTAQVAVAAATSRLETLFGLVDEEGSVPGLHAACSRFFLRAERPRPGLEVSVGEQAEREPAPDLTVTAVAVDRREPVLPEPRPGTTTVLAVSAGAATADQLARVAIAAADGGQPLKGIFVANPDSDDQTTGRFPDTVARTSVILQRRALGAPRPGLASGRAL